MGELGAFSIQQEAAIGVCEAQRDGAVALVDLMDKASAELAAAMKPKPWWAFWR